MTPTVLTEHNRPLPPRAHLTVQAADTCLTQHTVQLRLLGILPTDVADTSLVVIGDKAWLICGHRSTPLGIL